MNQISLFDGNEPLKLNNKIRLIELFAGYGSQSLALKYLGVPFEHWAICEWAVKSIQAYKDIHFTDDNTDYSAAYTEDELVDILYNKGISSNYNEPMTKEQIRRLPNKRVVYNNIVATNNLVSVCNVNGEDLNIVDTDKYTYIMSYSFPCQDLSRAGKGAGMGKDSGTRSGLLWEVERILNDLYNRGGQQELPQCLLLENVPDVISTNNVKHFANWVKFLDSLGYTSKWEVLNAKDYGVPQNRERCFMVSWLDDYYYDFPQPIKLTKRLKDVLETNVDEKFYLSDGTIDYFTNLKTQMCNKLIASGAVKENDVIRHSYTNSRMNGEMKDIQQNNISPTLDTRCDCLGVVTKYELSPQMKKYIVSGDDKYKVGENNLKLNRNIACAKTTREGCSRADTSDYISNDLCENYQCTINENLANYRIRKLTPRECFRLMGVKDEDFDKVAKHQSNSSLYHLAGDSIVVDVLMSIFKEML